MLIVNFCDYPLSPISIGLLINNLDKLHATGFKALLLESKGERVEQIKSSISEYLIKLPSEDQIPPNYVKINQLFKMHLNLFNQLINEAQDIGFKVHGTNTDTIEYLNRSVDKSYENFNKARSIIQNGVDKLVLFQGMIYCADLMNSRTKHFADNNIVESFYIYYNIKQSERDLLPDDDLSLSLNSDKAIICDDLKCDGKIETLLNSFAELHTFTSEL